MANDEHLALLKRGVGFWNEWKVRNPNVQPDLRGADLRGANLRSADLSGANLAFRNTGSGRVPDRMVSLQSIPTVRTELEGADLTETVFSYADLTLANLNFADLSRAHLGRADLGGAHLVRAILANADISGADLRGTNVRDADFSGADLTSANFSACSPEGANFRGAIMRFTVIGNVNLSGAQGLDECDHRGRSIIDFSTLKRSGLLPLSFLRGCGLPDNLIEHLPSLLNQPIQFYSCFISYYSKDDAFVGRLHADLQNKGIRCWFAPEDIKIGDRIRSRIDEVIHLHEKLLLVLLEHSIRSDWVEKEREGGGTVLFPVRLDDANLESRTGWAADIKRPRHIGDFTGWKDHDSYQKSFDRLLRDLRVDPPPASQASGD